MDKFINRFKYYLGGFIIGSIFVFFFFQNRGCSWLPGNRVKNTLLGKIVVLPESEKSQLRELGLSNDDLLTFLDDGDVVFGESIKEQDEHPKVYKIEKEFDDKLLTAQFSIYEDSYITVVELLKDDEKTHVVKKYEGTGDFLKFPMEEGMVYMDSSLLNCEFKAFKYNKFDSIQADMMKSTKIDFSNSDLMLPKAEHKIIFEDRKLGTVEARTIWFKSKIYMNKIDFEGRNELPCAK